MTNSAHVWSRPEVQQKEGPSIEMLWFPRGKWPGRLPIPTDSPLPNHRREHWPIIFGRALLPHMEMEKIQAMQDGI